MYDAYICLGRNKEGHKKLGPTGALLRGGGANVFNWERHIQLFGGTQGSLTMRIILNVHDLENRLLKFNFYFEKQQGHLKKQNYLEIFTFLFFRYFIRIQLYAHRNTLHI